MKKERWAAFWQDQKFFKWCLFVFVAGIICFNIAPEESGLKSFGAIAIVLTFIACISLFISASSHAGALNKHCRYLRTEFGRAATSDRYDDYLQRRNSIQ